MKQLMMAICCFSGLVAYSQYFQNTYDDSNFGNDQLTHGVNTIHLGDGHLMGGEGPSTLSGVLSRTSARFVQSDINGNPLLLFEYQLKDNNGTIYYDTKDQKVFEFDNGTGMGLIGRYEDPANPNNYQLYFLEMDNMGAVLTVFTYQVSGYEIHEIGNLVKSRNNDNTLFVVGTVRSTSTNTFHPFVVKIDYMSKTLVWSHVYNHMGHGPNIDNVWGMDIAEAGPLFSHANECVVAGYANDGTDYDGVLFMLDNSTGMAFGPLERYGDHPGNDRFYSIDGAADQPLWGFPEGFIIGGTTQDITNGDQNMWVVRIDGALGPVWQSGFDNSVNNGANDYCYDVTERINTQRQPEYYALGYTDNGPIGAEDVMTLKVDMGGTPVGEYFYGGSNNDRGRNVDFVNNMGTVPGLSIYGNYNDQTSDNLYHVKAYFNGFSGCNEDLYGGNLHGCPGHLGIVDDLQSVTNFTSGNRLAYDQGGLADMNLCFNNSIAGGSVAKTHHNNVSATLSPNPARSENSSIILELEMETGDELQISIYDMFGKNCFSINRTVVKGKNQLELNFEGDPLATGIYVVNVNGKHVNKSINLLIQ